MYGYLAGNTANYSFFLLHDSLALDVSEEKFCFVN